MANSHTAAYGSLITNQLSEQSSENLRCARQLSGASLMQHAPRATVVTHGVLAGFTHSYRRKATQHRRSFANQTHGCRGATLKNWHWLS